MNATQNERDENRQGKPSPTLSKTVTIDGLDIFYREAGRESDAARLENSLRDWLVLADTEFPLAQSLAGA